MIHISVENENNLEFTDSDLPGVMIRVERMQRPDAWKIHVCDCEIGFELQTGPGMSSLHNLINRADELCFDLNSDQIVLDNTRQK